MFNDMKKVYSTPTVSIKAIQAHAIIATSPTTPGFSGTYNGDGTNFGKSNKGDDTWNSNNRGW